MAVVVLAVSLALGLAERQQHRADAAADACRSEATDALEIAAGDQGFMTLPGDIVSRRADAYVVEVETWVLEDGRQVDDHRHRVMVCTATEYDGQWLGELEP